MNLDRINSGQKVSSISAILLFVFMFFDWFGIKAVNTSNLLFAIRGGGSGKSAWEALDVIPIVLVITIIVTLAFAITRLVDAEIGRSTAVNAVVGILGSVSTLLILFRIIAPPVFYKEPTITIEGAVQLPIFLALVSAAGIAIGGYWAMREEGANLLATRRVSGRGK